jgi:hypothetical protein
VPRRGRGGTGEGGRLCLAASDRQFPNSAWWWYFKRARLATSFKDISLLQGAARLQALLISLHLYCHHLRRPPLKLRRPRALCSAVTFQGRLFERGSPICWWSWPSNLPAAHRIRSYTGVGGNTSKGSSRQFVQPKSTARPLMQPNLSETH